MPRLRTFLVSTRRFLLRTVAGLAMFVVAVLCAFFAMRLAIHGREVSVPNLAGRSDADAATVVKSLGLNLSVENRFYSSAIPPNHVLSQSPSAGSRVRRGWQVRVTESLGGQKVPVPDVTGQTERPASLILRRLQLELGAVAHLPAPAPAGVVLAQSPPPNAVGLNGPRVALLVSDPGTPPESIAYVMPQLIGQTLATASNRLAAAGLHIASATEPDLAPTPDPNAAADPTSTQAGGPPSSTPSASSQSSGSSPMDQSFWVASPPPISANAVIISQSPAPGRRVSRADNIRVTLAEPPSAKPPTIF